MVLEVTCVTTDDESSYNDCRCIETIGYISLGSTRKKTPAEIHDKIKSGTEFYVKHNGSRSYLEAKSRNGTKCVRTESNDTKSDNFLKQPSC